MNNKINIAEILKDCPKKPRWDPVGMNIGSLKVLREVEHVRHPNGKTSRRFECLCKCGNYTYVLVDNLKRRTITAHLLGTTDPYTEGGSV